VDVAAEVGYKYYLPVEDKNRFDYTRANWRKAIIVETITKERAS